MTNLLYKSCTNIVYVETLRLKKSAAFATCENAGNTGISRDNKGLVQFICDNFDAVISSQNGKLSTHGLAMLVTQPASSSHKPTEDKITRVG